LTNPDKPRGRSGGALPTEAAAAAERYLVSYAEEGLPAFAVLKPETLKEQAREEAAAAGAGLLVCFAYGRIFGPKFLSLFPLGGINIHPSLLPKYRGASPIQQAILNGDTRTGVSIQKLAPKMDTGDIVAQTEFSLDGQETGETLGARVSEVAAVLLRETLFRIAETGAVEGKPQEGPASYCPLIEKNLGLINWEKSAQDIDRMIRAYTPWPLARTGHNKETLFILEAVPLCQSGPLPSGPLPSGPRARPGWVLGTDKQNGILIQTGDGILAVRRLQYHARKALSWRDFLNGARDFIGSRLVSEDC
jgi:methionyl-tRNA formyltransferase